MSYKIRLEFAYKGQITSRYMDGSIDDYLDLMLRAASDGLTIEVSDKKMQVVEYAPIQLLALEDHTGRVIDRQSCQTCEINGIQHGVLNIQGLNKRPELAFLGELTISVS